MLLDDAHYQAFGAAGHPAIKTPNLDALAARGIVFRQATAATPLCSPSRATLLTGRYSHQHGLVVNPAGEAGVGKPDMFDRPTVVRMLRDAGYQTAVFGKWHNWMSPAECGFETYRVGAPMAKFEWGRSHTFPAVAYADRPEMVLGEARKFIEAPRDRPFFVWIALLAPHYPLEPQEKYLKLYEGVPDAKLVPPGHAPTTQPSQRWRNFAAVMSQVDADLGDLLAALRRAGLAESTAVFIAGDNGINVGAHDYLGKIVPWEDSIRIPLLIAPPGTPRGDVCDRQVSSIDLPATWLEMAGAQPPSFVAGRSLLSLLRDPRAEWPDEAFVEFADEAGSGPNRQAYRLIRAARHKLVLFRSGEVMLFDLAADPHETRDLAGDPAHAKLRADLLARLKAWMQTTNDAALKWPGVQG